MGLPQHNSTRPRVGLALFSYGNHNHKTTNQTVSHFFSAPTQPNSTKFSMQPYFNPTRRIMKKKKWKTTSKISKWKTTSKISKWKTTSKNFKMEDDLKNFKMEDNLKNFKMEHDLKNFKMEDD